MYFLCLAFTYYLVIALQVSLHALKYSLQYPEVRIFTYLVQKYSHETQIIQHLTHFWVYPWHGVAYPKKATLG